MPKDTKRVVCYRLSESALRCLQQLNSRCPEYNSMTDVVEQAIIHEWEKHFGLVSTQLELDFGL